MGHLFCRIGSRTRIKYGVMIFFVEPGVACVENREVRISSCNFNFNFNCNCEMIYILLSDKKRV